MDGKEDLKIGVHSQHTRILKEEDEVWISSEDLNTENSSEDDGSAKPFNPKRKVKQKNRKRSTPSVQFQKVPDYRAVIFPDFLKKPEVDKTRPITPDSEDSDVALPPISSCTSAAKLKDVEDWRPMRGALSSKQDDSEFRFNQEHLCAPRKTSKLADGAANGLEIFRTRKNSSKIKKTLNFIANLESKINEAIATYQVERTERISMEHEMCREICSNKTMLGGDTSRFLNLCHENQSMDIKFSDCKREKFPFEMEKLLNNHRRADPKDQYLAKRNIRNAKEGVMAGFSLTDEEKSKISQLLGDIDSYELADNLVNSECDVPEDQTNEVTGSAFKVNYSEQMRIDEINNKLKEFASTRTEVKSQTVRSVDEVWRLYAREKGLKDINAQLEKLYESFK
ncbi:uncharacterized protein LOC132706632 [Cylas formicarius]|uniref:uncharacterized protein LOC132706632 n=1 Tax=Cylas formicarius TaxID=197179 RepID=UPI0029584FFC|nr:uncharacterized protein LOC132706632 [Cylas formicarius]